MKWAGLPTSEDSASAPREAPGALWSSAEKAWVWSFAAFAAGMIALAILGAVRSYSPVPFWDMWDGYLGFFTQLSRGDWSAWWAQHNEHRILLTRLFFWVDLKWLGGTSVILIAAIFAFVALIAFTFWCWLREILGEQRRSSAALVIGLFVAAWLFLWSQSENLTWGFQVQFPLVILLPLAALFWLQRAAVREGEGWTPFWIAAGLGFAAIGTMANGILVLPMMAVYSLLFDRIRLRAALLGALTAAELALYLIGYHSASQGSLLAPILHDPKNWLLYVLGYLGGPFCYIMRGPGIVRAGVAALAGLLLVVALAIMLWRLVRRHPAEKTRIALAFFVLFIMASAAITASGRLSLGLSTAFASRYTTATLAAWAAVLVLWSPEIVGLVHRRGLLLLSPLVVLAVALVPLQLTARISHPDELYQRRVAALALELGARDGKQIAHVFPSTDWGLQIAAEAVRERLSVFGAPPLVGLREGLGRPRDVKASREASGGIQGVKTLSGSQFIRCWGSFREPDGSVPRAVLILDSQNRLVGCALPTTVPRAVRVRGYSGLNFFGYLLAEQRGRPVRLVGDDGSQLLGSVPQ
jgi:hypothetical protein